MRRCLAMILLGLAATNAQALSTHDYERQRDSADVASFRLTRIYLTGVAAGYIWANAQLVERKARPFYCQPAPSAADLDYTRVVDDEIGQPYVTDDYPVELLLLNGLARKYPCNS